VVVITGDGLKTLDAVRDSFARRQIDPSVESFEHAIAQVPLSAQAAV
jgi:threonine synthase